MPIKESGENYLETIYLLHQQNGSVRSVDIAAALGYSKPSVSRAMSILRRDGIILVDASGMITLTDHGLTLARTLYERDRKSVV